ncbi:SUKH-4 family immunity protein [Kitasatospora sp. NPDC094015]|uniref:SUKH-4 family immunity protein n=1 Tax=Kitasatospora sp. NPDC094015 TaxID=3155205 RepID=UPI00331F7BC5
MVTTYAQAQETAEEWINGGVPRSQHREVRVREFDLGFVCWAEDRVDGSPAEGGGARLVITRDSGASTLWPPLPVNEVVRQFEELYGSRSEPNPAGAAKPVPSAVEATSFLLSPPQWFEQAGADALAAEAAELAAETAAAAVPPAAPPVAVPPTAAPPAAVPPTAAPPAPAAGGAVLSTPPASDRPAGDAPTMLAPPSAREGAPGPVPGAYPGSEGLTVPMPGGYGLGAPAGSEGLTVALPATAAPAPVPADPTMPMPEGFLAGVPDLTATPPPPPGAGPVPPPPGFPPPAPPAAPSVEHAPTMLATPDGPPPVPAQPAHPAPSIEYAPTVLATDGPPGLMGLPGAPGVPAPAPALGRSGPTAPPPPPPADLGAGPGHQPAAGGATGRGGPGAPPPPPPAQLHGSVPGPAGQAGTGRGGPGAPPPPVPADLGAGGGAQPPAEPPRPGAADVAYQATQLAPAIELPGSAPSGVPPVAPPPVGYGYPAAGAVPAPAPVAAPPAVPHGLPQPPAAPAAPGVPAIGPGTQAVVSYRGPDGSEQTLLHRSEPGTPHPEWKALHELRRLNVPPDQVLELHTDLELCDLPGGYCARMVKASWPNVRISHTIPYGRDLRARQAGTAQLNDHLDQLHQLAAAPHRPRPVRVPLPAPGVIPQLPPLAPQQLAGELAQAYGQGVFRFEQRAVSRQGVPEPVSATLMWAGLPREFAPFFWAQAQEGRPIPTLAELAAERGRPAAPDFGGYLVLGNDYGRQLCVQYGTAAVVAVDLEGQGEAPRFVNSGVPEFVRSLAALGRMWRLRYGLTPEQAGRWTTDLQAELVAIDPAALYTPESWWSVLVEQFWDGLM